MKEKRRISLRQSQRSCFSPWAALPVRNALHPVPCSPGAVEGACCTKGWGGRRFSRGCVPVPAAGPAGLCPGSRAAQVPQNCPAGFPHTQPPSLHSTLLAGLCSGLREAAVLFQEDVMDLQQGTYGSWCLASAVRGSGSSDSGKLLKVSVEKLILPQ